MISKLFKLMVAGAVASILAACGGGGGGSSATTPPAQQPQTSTVSLLVSDASTEDWSLIGVKILSVALVPQGGGTNVTVYTSPGSSSVNLAQLDNVVEVMGNVVVPVGTYTGAVLTLSANPGDIALTVSGDPETGFPGTMNEVIPQNQIQIQHTQGTAPSLTVPVTVNFVSPVVVSTAGTTQVDFEFDLAHPAFIVGHVPVGQGGTTIWAVNFDKDTLRHHPLGDITRLVLRHMYGDVTATDSASITITKEFPTLPVVSPETSVAGMTGVQILADATNGTVLYDIDAKTRTVIDNFSMESGLVSRYVRVAARYQQDGTLVATRIWVGNSFNEVWQSPEGHVLHVNATTDVVTIDSESGVPMPITVNANTQFFFRTPGDPSADGTAIATGTSFLTSDDLVRGFKVHATPVDWTASPVVAQSIEIESARYDGAVSYPAATAPTTAFTLTHIFHTTTDNYAYSLDYINANTPNGDDFSSPPNKLMGYKWWNFAYPVSTLMDTVACTSDCPASTAIPDWVSATNGTAVNFGGTLPAIPTYASSFAVWADAANPTGWSAAASILEPSVLPLGIASALSMGSFTMSVTGGTMTPTINVSETSGSATLVYQVDRTNNIVTVSPIDITTTAGENTLTNALMPGTTPVKVFGVPQSNGSMNAYVLAYFTGDMPGQ
ncbi:MAG: DUF4382 domain-containing protein [Steroidobacteraceae bacterium]